MKEVCTQDKTLLLLFNLKTTAWMQKQAGELNDSCGFTLPVFAGIFALQHQLFVICNGKIKSGFLTVTLHFGW